MNKTKIDWCDSTWNPVTGCFHGCEYCYARGIAKRFGGASETHHNETVGEECQWMTEAEGKIHVLDDPIYDYDYGRKAPYPYEFDPTFHKYRLNEYQNKKGRNIFVCSMADLFGKWVPDEWIEEVFDACKRAPQHNYLFLTKNPGRYIELEKERKLPFAHNFWFGTSVTKVTDKYTWFMEKKFHWFLSVEPMLEGLGEMAEGAPKPEWLIIGAETGNRKNKVVPKKEWLEKLVSECGKYGIPVFMKSSLENIWEGELIQEFPDDLI